MRRRIALLAALALLVSCSQDAIEEYVEPAVAVTGVTLSPASLTLYENETSTLKAVVQPKDADNPSVVWESQDEDIVTVDETGTVHTLKAGKGVVKVTTVDGGFSSTCLVTVFPAIDPTVHVISISLDRTAVTLQIATTARLAATILPENADDKVIAWSVDDPSVATVSDGLVTAVSAGTAIVTATTHDGGFTATCTVTVPSEDDPANPEERWTDTGADVPVYPNYNPVSSFDDFPLVEVTTDSGYPVADKVFEPGTIRFSDPKGMYSTVKEIPTMAMEIRGRGNSTWEGQWGRKNPYRVKLSAHTKIFGMKGDKDWILLSDRLDNSLIRTALALRISRLVSMPWTPKFRMVRLNMNGEYAGLYYLVEQKEVDRDNKIPVTIRPGIVDSGYLLELDNKWDEDAYFTSEYFEKTVKYKDPDPYDDDPAQRMTDEQKSYITDYFNSVEKALQDRDWDEVHNLIEMDSWIQYYIVNEVSMNKDGNMRLSTYFAKDSDTKLFMPMVWDFDRAFGQDSYQQKEFALPEWWPYGWFIRIRGGYPNGEESSYYYQRGKRATWYQYLFEDPVFVDRLKELWNLYKPRLDGIPQFIDKMLEYNDLVYSSSNKSAIRQIRSDYILRMEWLDEHINALEPERYNASTGNFEPL